MDEDLKAELTCPICMDLFQEPRRLPCGHVYCRACLQDMLTRKYLHTRSSERILSCPECRQQYNLTFREGGVDCFPRDFKLVRLVELYEKRFACSSSEAKDQLGGRDKGDDDETAVKTVHGSNTAQENSAASESACRRSSSSHQLSSRLLESDLHSFGSGAGSLSDDSWIYVTPGVEQGQRAGPSLRDVRERGRMDDSWLLPSVLTGEARFPVGGDQDIRGNIAGVDYGAGSHPGTSLNISGSYENQGHERFQRYAAEVSLQPRTAARVAVPQVSTSDSSSETASSDERGEEGSGERSEEDVSETASEGSSQRQNRRSRLTRFFRSLVLSDSDSYDDEELVSDTEARRSAHVPRPPRPDHQAAGLGVAHGETAAFSSVHRSRPPHADHPVMSLTTGAAVPPEVQINTACQSVSHSGQNADVDGQLVSSQNHNSADATASDSQTGHQDCPRGATLVNTTEGPTLTQNGPRLSASGGGGGAQSAASPRQEDQAVDADSDDSDNDYEPQTSMLRPKRKPRSRLKKFFTSLLSLSSSDEEDEEEAAVPSPPTATLERN